MALDHLVLYLAAGAAAGVLSGLFGVGGGIVAVPAAILIGGLGFKDAKAASLVVLALGGGAAAWRHLRAGNVRMRLGVILGVGGLVGALAGSRVAEGLPERALEGAFGVLLVGTALRLWFPTPERPGDAFPLPLAMGIGVVGGALAGLFGVGGGIVMVPAMALFGVGIHAAVGTSLVAVLTNGVFAAGAHLWLGYGPVMWRVGVPMAVAAAFTSWAGAHLANVSPAARLRRAFAVFLAILGVRFVWVAA